MHCEQHFQGSTGIRREKSVRENAPSNKQALVYPFFDFSGKNFRSSIEHKFQLDH